MPLVHRSPRRARRLLSDTGSTDGDPQSNFAEIHCCAVPEALSLRWIVDVARHKDVSRNVYSTIAIATLLLFAANPWIYRSAAQDFHFHAISACFVLGAGLDLWAARYRRGAVWVALALAS